MFIRVKQAKLDEFAPRQAVTVVRACHGCIKVAVYFSVVLILHYNSTAIIIFRQLWQCN